MAGAQQHPTLPTCQPNDPDLLLPDLVPETPTQIRNVHRMGSRVIAFTSAVGNIGDGPLIMEGQTVSTADGLKTRAWQIIWKRSGGECARVAGDFIFHPAHFHWHFERFNGYYLLNSGGTLVAGGQKTSFCLLDVGLVQGYRIVEAVQQIRNNNCGPEGRQGISVGWKDVYLHNYADQYVALDRDTPFGPVPMGPYTLVNDVDPDGLIWEKRRDNNIATVPVGVVMPPPASGVVIPATPTPRAPAPPDIRVPPTREARPPRPTRVPREAARQIPTRPPRPTRVVPPTRTPRGGGVVVPSTPTRTPMSGGGVPSNPTPTAMSGGGTGGRCNSACIYSLAQVRMTWYDATGLNMSALITPSRGCPVIDTVEGQSVKISMYDWLKVDRSDTGINIGSDFVLGRSGSMGSNSDGSVTFSRVGDSLRFGLNMTMRAPARAADGMDFPVVFWTCVHIGDQQVEIRQVCQPKATGLLCHI